MKGKKTFSNDDLSLEITETDTTFEIRWLGKSIDREPGKFLNQILSNLLMEGKKNSKRLVLDFHDLSYMNSSTIMTISKFLENGNDGNNDITIKYDIERRWQKLSFNALKIFQTKDDTILFEGSSDDTIEFLDPDIE